MDESSSEEKEFDGTNSICRRFYTIKHVIIGRLGKWNVLVQPLKALYVHNGNVFESVQCCIICRQVLIQLVCNLEWEGG